jgi:hypothetical protein
MRGRATTRGSLHRHSPNKAPSRAPHSFRIVGVFRSPQQVVSLSAQSSSPPPSRLVCRKYQPSDIALRLRSQHNRMVLTAWATLPQRLRDMCRLVTVSTMDPETFTSPWRAPSEISWPNTWGSIQSYINCSYAILDRHRKWGRS